MTIPGAPVRYDVTRIALMDALGNHPLGAYLHLEARGRMADALLVNMPEALDEAAIRADERERVAAEFEAMCRGPYPPEPAEDEAEGGAA